MARTKSMHVWFWTLNSEWTYIINDNTGTGGSSLPLGPTHFTDISGDIVIESDRIFVDFPDVAFITLGDSMMTSFNYAGFSILIGDNLMVESMNALSEFSGVSTASSVDLTPVMTALSQIQAKVDTVPDFEAVSSIVSSSLSSLDSVELNNLHEDIVALGTQLSTVTVPLQSLNGNGTEFMDGVEVSVTGRTIPYTVSRSYMSLMNTDTYTIVYDLVAADGSKVTCPESFLTLYVAPVVTP